MARNPQERYQSSRELRYALEHYEQLEGRTMKRQKKGLFFAEDCFCKNDIFHRNFFVFRTENNKIEKGKL